MDNNKELVMDDLDYVDDAVFTRDFLSKNAGVKNKLIELFGKYSKINHFWKYCAQDVIRSISQNKKLFFAYSRGDFKKHYDLEEAFCDVGDNILISFTDLKLYAIVESLDDFKEFIGVLPGIVNEGNNCNLHQIILTTQQQKIIFIGNDINDKSVESIKTHVKNYLKADISVTDIEGGKQITIEKIVSDYMTGMREFIDLQDYIDKRDDDIRRTISLISRSFKHHYKYIEANVTECINTKTMVDLIQCLKTVTCETLNITINTGQIINGDHNTMNVNTKVDKEAIAREWVAKNPPTNKEITTDYYNRYKSQNTKLVSVGQFGPMVAQLGFTKRHSGKNRYWEK